MKVQIRRGVFETNSSSTHSITITTKDKWESFQNDEIFYNNYNDEFVDLTFTAEETNLLTSKFPNFPNLTKLEQYTLAVEEEIIDDFEIVTYDKYMDDEDLAFYKKEYTTEHGDNIVVFGKYGYC